MEQTRWIYAHSLPELASAKNKKKETFEKSLIISQFLTKCTFGVRLQERRSCSCSPSSDCGGRLHRKRAAAEDRSENSNRFQGVQRKFLLSLCQRASPYWRWLQKWPLPSPQHELHRLVRKLPENTEIRRKLEENETHDQHLNKTKLRVNTANLRHSLYFLASLSIFFNFYFSYLFP